MRKLLILLIITVTVGFVYYFIFYAKDKFVDNSTDVDSSDSSAMENSMLIDNLDPVFAEPVVYSSLNQSYTSEDFSFKYSDGFKVYPNLISISEQVFTVENEKGTGFQIYAAVFDEKGPITPERIWQDEPYADVLEPKIASLDGIQTLVFYGYNGDIGETFEAWVVYKGKLYQITGPKTAEQLIIETLNTWDWK